MNRSLLAWCLGWSAAAACGALALLWGSAALLLATAPTHRVDVAVALALIYAAAFAAMVLVLRRRRPPDQLDTAMKALCAGTDLIRQVVRLFRKEEESSAPPR